MPVGSGFLAVGFWAACSTNLIVERSGIRLPPRRRSPGGGSGREKGPGAASGVRAPLQPLARSGLFLSECFLSE